MVGVPDRPASPLLTVISNTVIQLNWGGSGNNNGSAVDLRVFWGSNNTTPTYVVPYEFNYQWSGLTPGTPYFFWAREHNAYGWSDFSPHALATTHDIPDAPDPVALSFQTQTTVKAQFTDNDLGGVPALERQIAYGKDPTTPELFVSSNNTTIEDLDPGQIYYFWARIRNAYGWGPYCARTQVTLRAGARVNQAGVWKRAVPYVRVGGVWMVARPWVKDAGVWKETSS